MAKAFLNYQDTVMRLQRTICMYRDKPMYVYVDEIEDRDKYDNTLNLYPLCPNGLRSSKATIIKVTDKEFSYKEMPLGYILFEDECVYLTRNPDRKNNQGLHPNVLYTDPGFRNYNSNSWFKSVGMENCIMGTHPSYKEALILLDSTNAYSYSMVPFHRHFAVGFLDSRRRTKGIFCRGRLVATYDLNGSAKLLEAPDASFIRPLLEKLGVL